MSNLSTGANLEDVINKSSFIPKCEEVLGMIKNRMTREEFAQIKDKIWSPTKYVYQMLHFAKRDGIDPENIDIWASYCQHILSILLKENLELPAKFAELIKKSPRFSEILRQTIVSVCACLGGKRKFKLAKRLKEQGVPPELLVRTGQKNRKGCWRTA